MKQYFKRGITLIIVLSIIFTGCGLFPEEEEFPTVPIVESYEKKEYKQTVVVRGDLVLTESIRCRYTPVQTETLSFQLDDMYIESVYVTEGDIVEVGDLLAQLRIDDLEKQVQEQNYQILLLNMQIEHLYEDWELEAIDEDGRLTAIEKELAQVRELIWLLDVWLQQGEKPEAVNGKSWYVEEEPTQLSMEELKSIESQLKAERDARLDEIELTQDYEKRLRDLHNALLVAEMKLDELEEALEKRRIYAGINGTIVYASNTAVSGSKSIEKELVFTVWNLDTTVFLVEGEDAQYFPVGTEVVITSGENEYPVCSVKPSELGIEGKEGIAYLQVLELSSTLQNNDIGKAEVVIESRQDVLYIKKNAIKTVEGAPFVYILDEEGLKVMQSVVTGLETAEYVEIISGLTEGDSVIIE